MTVTVTGTVTVSLLNVGRHAEPHRQPSGVCSLPFSGRRPTPRGAVLAQPED